MPTVFRTEERRQLLKAADAMILGEHVYSTVPDTRRLLSVQGDPCRHCDMVPSWL